MRVQLSGLSLNAFITAAALGASIPRARPRSAPLDKKTLAKLLFQASRISDRLEKEPQGSAGPEHAALVEECRDELAEIRTCLMLALGRAP